MKEGCTVYTYVFGGFFDSREEVEHMKKKIDWKDAQISDLIKEKGSPTVNAQVPSTRSVTLPRLSASSVHRDSPDSTREIEKVYQQFDRLVFIYICLFDVYFNQFYR